MATECVLFNNAEELIEWLDNYDILLNLSKEEATILLSYMEGHGYGLGAQGEEFLRAELNEETITFEDYSIDDAIDTIFEWNYELQKEADNERKNPNNFIDFCNKQDRYEELVRDEKVIQQMFDRTIYGKQINEELRCTVQIK